MLWAEDIKIQERFILDESLSLLVPFDTNINFQKAEDDTTHAEGHSLLKHVEEHSQQQHKDKGSLMEVVDPEDYFNSLTVFLTKDASKSVWKCLTKVTPNILLAGNICGSAVEQRYQRVLRQFAEKYKCEHEDGSCIQISIRNVMRGYVPISNGIPFSSKACTSHFIRLLSKFIDDIAADSQREVCELNGINSGTSLEQQLGTVEWQHLWQFSSLWIEEMERLVNFQTGSMVFGVLPQLSTLVQLVSPTLLGLFCYLANQIQLQAQGIGTQILLSETKLINCSKIVLLNLDGFEHELNIDFAKYLHKCLLYISFPVDCRAHKDQTVRNKSLRLLRKYCTAELSASQRQELSHFVSPRETHRNLCFFPIYSVALQQKYALADIRMYQSTFVRFVLKEIIYERIREFSPQTIVLSYSPRLQLNLEDWRQIVQEVTILSNYRVLFCPNTSEILKHFVCQDLSIANQQSYPFSTCSSPSFSKSFNQEKGILLKADSSEIPEGMLEESSREIHEQFPREMPEELPREMLKGLKRDLLIQMPKQMVMQTPTDTVLVPETVSQLLQIMCVFLKVSSGTANLEKPRKENALICKYHQSLVLGYFAQLLTILAQDGQTLTRYSKRAGVYKAMHESLKQYYSLTNFQSLFSTVLSPFHNELLQTFQATLSSQHPLARKINATTIPPTARQCFLEQQVNWNQIKFEYCLQQCFKKVSRKHYCHILPPLQSKSSSRVPLTVHFQVCNSPIELPEDCQIYYSRLRQSCPLIIYLLNHLGQTDTAYRSYCGMLDESLINNVNKPVKLHEVIFEPIQALSGFSHRVAFNHFETTTHTFLFWPRLCDQLQALQCRLLREKYMPKTTSLIYRASKLTPTYFECVNVHMPSRVQPRTGCTSYHVPNTNIVYIFGGTYDCVANLMAYQTDISLFNVDTLTLETVPKVFYFAFSHESQLVSQLRNDYIRPKVGYEIIEISMIKSESACYQILLVGGVGQKYIRDFSLLSSTIYKICFNHEGVLTSTRKVKLPYAIHANFPFPHRQIAGLQAHLVDKSLNLEVKTHFGKTCSRSWRVSHHCHAALSYLTQELFCKLEGIIDPGKHFIGTAQKLVGNGENIVDNNLLEYREEVHRANKPHAQNGPQKLQQCRLLSREGSIVVVSLRDTKIVRINLCQQPQVSLLGLIAVQIDYDVVYAIANPVSSVLYCHQLSGNQHNLNTNQQDLDTNQQNLYTKQVVLQPIYYFELSLSRYAIKVINSAIVAIVQLRHADPSQSDFIIKRSRKGAKCLPIVRQHTLKNTHRQREQQNVPWLHAKSSLIFQGSLTVFQGSLTDIFYVKANCGVLLCVTFSAPSEQTQWSMMNVLVEGLDLMLEQPSWTVKWCGRRRFICGLEDSQDTTSFSVIGLHALLQERAPVGHFLVLLTRSNKRFTAILDLSGTEEVHCQEVVDP